MALIAKHLAQAFGKIEKLREWNSVARQNAFFLRGDGFGLVRTLLPPNKTVIPHTPTNSAEKETTRHEFEKKFFAGYAARAISIVVGGWGVTVLFGEG